MPRRTVLGVLAAVAFAALALRLGVWQLHRLAQRRALNARVAARLAAPPLPATALPRDTASTHYRRVVVEGTADYAGEFALAARTHEGSPGVNIMTPVRLPGTDTALLVNRGWVYSADGATVDFRRWREPEQVRLVGYVETFPPSRAGAVLASSRARAVFRLDYPKLLPLVPFPLAPVYVVVTEPPAANPDGPVRLGPPRLDEGPHKSYAIQWFSFAAIALVGSAFVLWSERRGRAAPSSAVGNAGGP